MLVGVGRRPETTSIRCAQLPQWHANQIHDVLAHFYRFQSDFHTDEGFSDKAKSPLPSNLPIAADAAYLPTLGITQLQLVGPPVRSVFAVTFRRRSLAQRFVRTNSIVATDPAIGSPLLSSHRAGGWSRQVGFEFPMHLFVRTILFGMTRRNKLHLDAQRCPPGTQTRQPRRAVGSKRAAIVHPDNPRQTKTPEQPYKHCARTPPLLVGQQPDRQKISTEQIPYGQRFDPLSIVGSEPAFEIHCPHLIGSRRHRQSRAQQPRAVGRPGASGAGQLPSLQPQRDRSYCRNPLTGRLTTQLFPEFLGSPAPMSAPQTSDPPQPASRGLMGGTFGAARAVAQSAQTLPQETSLPFVAGLATDPENAAHFRKGLLGLQHQFYKAGTRLYQRNRFP